MGIVVVNDPTQITEGKPPMPPGRDKDNNKGNQHDPLPNAPRLNQLHQDNDSPTLPPRDQNKTEPAKKDTPTKDGKREAPTERAGLDQWKKDTANTPGYRFSRSVVPGKFVITVEVSSFMQVPEILQMLDKDAGRREMRLCFPAPPAGSPNAEAIRAEQASIREFLRTKAGASFPDICQELSAKIEGCIDFGKYSGGKVSASSWVDSHTFEIRKKPPKLVVSDVYKTDAAITGSGHPLDSLLVRASNAVEMSSTKKTIITVSPENAQALAEKIREHLEQKQGALEGLAQAIIWIGYSKDAFDGATISDADCKQMRAFAIKKFLKRYPATTHTLDRDSDPVPAPTPVPSPTEDELPQPLPLDPTSTTGSKDADPVDDRSEKPWWDCGPRYRRTHRHRVV